MKPAAESIRLKQLLREITQYVGYVSCQGNKCRLPHCYDCSSHADEACEKLDALLVEIKEVLT